MEILGIISKNDILFSVTVLGVAFALSFLAYMLANSMLRPLAKITIMGKFKIPPSYIEAPLRSLIPAAALMLSIPLLRFGESVMGFVVTAGTVWLIASIGWLLTRIVHTARESFLSLYDVNTPDNLKARSIYTQVRVIENIAVALILFLTASFILLSFEQVRRIGTSLLASAGILGIILGFAAQKTLGNFIAGIQIAFAQPIRLDDVVIVENEWGWIEEITLTYVVVRIWDLRRLVLPISYFVENPFQNWTRNSADILGSVFIYADYTVPIKKLREKLTELLENSPLWDRKVNVLQVTEARENTVEIRALMSAKDSPTAWDLRCAVREELLTFLQEECPENLPRTRVELNRKNPQEA